MQKNDNCFSNTDNFCSNRTANIIHDQEFYKWTLRDDPRLFKQRFPMADCKLMIIVIHVIDGFVQNRWLHFEVVDYDRISTPLNRKVLILKASCPCYSLSLFCHRHPGT